MQQSLLTSPTPNQTNSKCQMSKRRSIVVMQPKIYSPRVTGLLILPVSLVLLAISTSFSFASTTLVGEESTTCSPKQASKTVVTEAQNSPTIPLNSPPQYRYSPSTPLIADTYPSVYLCARSFAVRIANGIRENNLFSPQTNFSIELATDIHSADTTDWQSSEKFIADFQKELEGQFPAGTFIIVNKPLQIDETNANSKLQTMNIDFSHIASKEVNTAKESFLENEPNSSGSIQMNWAIGNSTPSQITLNYVTKQWVATDRNWSHDHPKSFGFYHSKDYRSKVIGFTNRLTRSPQEASRLAMQNAAHFHSLHYGFRFSPDDFEIKVVDRFQQKLSTPSGELWQEALLASISPKKNASKIRPASTSVISAELLLILLAGAFGVIWISRLLLKAIF